MLHTTSYGGIIARHGSYTKEHNHSDQELGEGSKEGSGFNTNIVGTWTFFLSFFYAFFSPFFVLTDFLLTSHWTWCIDLAQQHMDFTLSP